MTLMPAHKHKESEQISTRLSPKEVEEIEKLADFLRKVRILAVFSSLRAGEAIVNLAASSGYEGGWWGRVIFRV